MRFHKCADGVKIPFDAAEISLACHIIVSHGGTARVPLVRPFGPDAVITHRVFDFADRGFAYSIDVRAFARRGVLRHHEVNTDDAVHGSVSANRIGLALITQLGLVG